MVYARITFKSPRSALFEICLVSDEREAGLSLEGPLRNILGPGWDYSTKKFESITASRLIEVENGDLEQEVGRILKNSISELRTAFRGEELNPLRKALSEWLRAGG